MHPGNIGLILAPILAWFGVEKKASVILIFQEKSVSSEARNVRLEQARQLSIRQTKPMGSYTCQDEHMFDLFAAGLKPHA